MAADPLTAGLNLGVGLLDLGRVALEKVAPADPEERRKWQAGKDVGHLAGLVAFLDVRITTLEGRGKVGKASSLRALRARATAQLVELRKTVDLIDGWRGICVGLLDVVRSLEARGAVVTYRDGSTEPLPAVLRRTLSAIALRLHDEDDDDKAAKGGTGGTDA